MNRTIGLVALSITFFSMQVGTTYKVQTRYPGKRVIDYHDR